MKLLNRNNSSKVQFSSYKIKNIRTKNKFMRSYERTNNQ